MVRIRFPPAGSLQTFGPSRVAAIESVAEPETRPQNPDRPWQLAQPNAASGEYDLFG